MAYKSVEILDIRSATVTAIIGEGGVNNTFVFKGAHTEEYDGYANGRFYSEEALKKAVYSVLASAAQSAGENHRTIYVGVPADFTKIVQGPHLLGFPSPKKITASDIETLYRNKYPELELPDYEKIHASAFYFRTSDSRKLADPIGIVSSTLQANVSYILCNAHFVGLLRDMLTEYGFKDIRFISSSFAQVKGLLDREGKDSTVLIDAGMVSSAITLFYGDGIMLEESVPFGEADIIADFYSHFQWSYEKATDELKKANLFRRGQSMGATYPDERYVSPEQLNALIIEGLDRLGEPISLFLEKVSPALLTGKIYITGEGITGIRGGVEQISKRLERTVEIISPHLPYYDKPSMSSRIALLQYALKEKRKDGFFRKLLYGIGG